MADAIYVQVLMVLGCNHNLSASLQNLQVRPS